MQFIKFNTTIFASLFLTGICLAQICYYSKNNLFLLFFILFITILFYKHKSYKHNSNQDHKFNQLLLILFSIGLGFGWICWNIDLFKKQNINFYEQSYEKTGVPILVKGTVVGLPLITKDSITFDFLIQDHNKIRLKWFKFADQIKFGLNSGDYWQLYVKLKKPRNFATPGSFDVEKYMFTEKIMATGKIINSPNNLLKIAYKDRTNKLSNINFFIDHVRQTIIKKINNLNNLDYINIILAMGLGSKNNIGAKDLLTFQDTGTAHLLAISGLHISFMAGLGFLIMMYLWKRLAPVRLLEDFPAPIVSSVISMLCAMLYASLSGFNTATNRALIMSSIYLLAIIFRKNITVVQIYCLALISVLFLEPFAVLSGGFWLSFVAVGILLYKKPKNLIQTNWCMLIGLLPISVLYFGKISLVSIIANFIAIPLVTFLVLPWIFIGLVLYGIFNLSIGTYSLIFSDLNLKILIFLLRKLENIKYAAISISSPTFAVFFISFIGSIWLLAPKGLLNRSLAIICFLPLFFNKGKLPVYNLEYGNAVVSVLDVGQGLAVAIKLKNHVLLYDAGANNKVAANYFKNFNTKVIDHAIISHTDFDHIGGLEEIIKQNTVNNFITNTDYKILDLTASVCNANQKWYLDGVKFEFLHPSDTQNLIAKKYTKNDYSCVLKISTTNHSILLTGDISKITENFLVQQNHDQLKSDILLIPHHGSRSSSSNKFIDAVNPQYAVVSAGYMNQYGHPKPRVLNKYLAKNITVLNTIEHGTVDFILKSDKIEYSCYRIINHNFWNY